MGVSCLLKHAEAKLSLQEICETCRNYDQSRMFGHMDAGFLSCKLQLKFLSLDWSDGWTGGNALIASQITQKR